MLNLTTRGPKTACAIADRVSFKTSGALSGDAVTPGTHHSTGMLCVSEQQRFFATTDIDYIVYSYATPIAWHSVSQGWYKVRQKFSVTTSRHQGNLYMITEGGDVEGGVVKFAPGEVTLDNETGTFYRHGVPSVGGR